MFRKLSKPFVLAIFSVLALLSASLEVGAQSGEPVWTPPINLSNSGSTSSPVGVLDESGIFHVVWSDTISGYVYSRHDGVEWSEPESLLFPFDPETTIFLRLLSDNTGRIHAFWIEEVEDEIDLYHSFVPSESFSNRAAWGPRRLLETDVSTVEAIADAHDGIHAIYVKALDGDNEPAGVYYSKSANRGNSWLQPQLFLSSPYYRDLPAEEINLSIISGPTGESDWILAAWDNQPRELVFSTRSGDGGAVWEEALVIDGPIEIPDTHTKFQIELAANGQNLLRLWESGIPGENCSHSYQSSSDGGQTWGKPEAMLEDFTGCIESIHFFTVTPDLMILSFRHRSLPYLIAWNNLEWGEPILQSDLTELSDPETLNQVILNCIQGGVYTETLRFVGCDDNGADIWTSSRQLSDGEEWYPALPTWSIPVDIASSPSELLDPQVLVDSEDRVHIIWVQVVEQEGVQDISRIFYSRKEAGAWSTPRNILSSPEGDALNPSVFLDRENRLHVVWSQGEAGKLFYSWANTGSAVSLTEWSEPDELPVPRDAAGSPGILIDAQGKYYVIYTIPLNDERGVYLIWSEDDGDTWSEPTLIFDAGGAGWDMVEDPQLAVSENNVLNAMWTRSTLPGGRGAFGLFTARSDDGGTTWRLGEGIEADAILWSSLVNSNELAVHQVWDEPIVDHIVFRHQESADTGQLWTSPTDLTGLAEAGPADLSVDSLGQLHLVHLTEEIVGSPVLNEWSWDGGQWLNTERIDLRNASIQEVISTSSHTGPSGLSGAVMIGQRPVNEAATGEDEGESVETETVHNVMVYTERRYDLSSLEPVIVPTLTVTPPPTQAPEATLQAQLTPTVDLSDFTSIGASRSGLLDQMDGWAGAVVGIISAGLIIVVVIVIGVRRQRR